MNSITPPTIPTLVVVERRPDLTGNAGQGKYQVTCIPECITVTDPNTIIVYQMIAPTPSDIVFTGIDRSKPFPGPQLSALPIISFDGKMMALFDANTVKEQIHVFLQFRDTDAENAGSFDPQVINIPRG